ncbi:MAG: phosphate ABC transporter permease PstA [Clostridia bacterium]|nr:phosphate ABC transporter permease PstA [Clostridia bacterium]
MRKLYSALKYVCIACLAISLIALVAVVAYVLINGIGNLSFNLVFGEYKPDAPTLLPALVGTLELVAIAAIIAVPIGIASAIFLVEYTNNKGKFVKIVGIATETLAGIPSIVYGLFGYLIFVVAFGWGYSLLGGAITLAIMILPTIVRSTQESLLSVQGGLREGAYALGTSKVRTIFKIVLPSAAGGIVTAIILAIGRVVSESAVLILTIGMVVNKVPETLMAPGTSLALDIYYFANHGRPDEAAATAVVLLILVMLLNLLAGWIGNLIKKSTYGDAK